jgi:hypothetical protein
MYPIFKCLSIENIVTLFELLLTEYKIILLSDHASILTLVCETVCGWLYPFSYYHIYIPVLPLRLLNYIQAPMPFLVGIVKQSFDGWEKDEWRPADVF